MADNVTEVLMPLMGEGITEATLVKWLKKPGDHVRKEEPLLEVSTDKVDTEIPSPAAGILLATFAADGETVAVNKIIATVAAQDSAVAGEQGATPKTGEQKTAPAALAARSSSQAPAAAGAAKTAPKLRPEPALAASTPQAALSRADDRAVYASPRAGGSSVRSSPLVRKIAKDRNVALEGVAGTGLGGRITKRDLEQFSAPLGADVGISGSVSVPRPATSVSPPAPRGSTPSTGEGRLETRQEGGKELLGSVPVRREKMGKMRGLIAEHMLRSVRTSPHVTTVFEIDLHRVVKSREQNRASFAAREGFNLTYTPFFVYAAVQAIKSHPVVNVSVDGSDILWKDQINIGVAVAIESGLIVPVIKNAGELSLLGIARRLNDLATRARTKKLLPEDVQDGTFSITNPGMFGSLVSAPIINQPQVAILSIGAIIKRPVVIDDLIGVRPLVQIGLTFDHRVVDGEGGARYLASLKQGLENFENTVT